MAMLIHAGLGNFSLRGQTRHKCNYLTAILYHYYKVLEYVFLRVELKQEMIDFKNLLAVGATNRNLGKTEFICQLIKEFSHESIIALKIKTFYPGDKQSHGKGSGFSGDYLVRKENDKTGLDDSKRFLKAGATSVYYIKSRIQDLEKAINEVKSKFPVSQLFIAESNSLLEYYQPGISIMIQGPDISNYKPSSLKFMDRSDRIIKSDGRDFDVSPIEIGLQIKNSTWFIPEP